MTLIITPDWKISKSFKFFCKEKKNNIRFQNVVLLRCWRVKRQIFVCFCMSARQTFSVGDMCLNKTKVHISHFLVKSVLIQCDKMNALFSIVFYEYTEVCFVYYEPVSVPVNACIIVYGEQLKSTLSKMIKILLTYLRAYFL